MHNADYADDHSGYANLLFVATRLLRQHGIGDGPSERIPDEVYKRLGLSPEDAEEVLEQVLEKADGLSDLVSLLNQPK
jgi:hypothetical protein